MTLATPHTLHYRTNLNTIILKILKIFLRVRYFSGNAMQQYQTLTIQAMYV